MVHCSSQKAFVMSVPLNGKRRDGLLDEQAIQEAAGVLPNVSEGSQSAYGLDRVTCTKAFLPPPEYPIS